MMEKLGAPQTHLGLKNMIKEVDEDFDGKLSFREVRVKHGQIFTVETVFSVYIHKRPVSHDVPTIYRIITIRYHPLFLTKPVVPSVPPDLSSRGGRRAAGGERPHGSGSTLGNQRLHRRSHGGERLLRGQGKNKDWTRETIFPTLSAFLLH